MVTEPPVLLLVGGPGPDPARVDVVATALAQARTLGFRTHLIDDTATLTGSDSVASLADRCSPVDVESPRDAVDWALTEVGRGARFDAVVGTRDSVGVCAAELAHALGVPGNAPDAVRAVRSKDVCRATLHAAGHLQPAFRVCTTAAEADAFLRVSSGPWVVKPRDGAGGVGVSKVCGPSDLPTALAGLPGPEPFLVEEFVTGREFSAEGIFLGGVGRVLALTAKEKLPPPYFVGIGHVAPSELPVDTQREIEHEVTAALATLGLRCGLFHVELWLNPGGVVIGEVHVHAGDGWIHLLLGHAFPSVDLFGLACADAVGLPTPTRRPMPSRAAAVRFFDPPPGRLIAVEGWQRLLDDPAVLHADLAVAPGDLIRPIRDTGDRVGAVVVGGRTPARARAAAWELAASVRFVVDEGADDTAGRSARAGMPAFPSIVRPPWRDDVRDIVRR
jgi:hypothetical protein